MKRIILILAVVIGFVSCSKDNDEASWKQDNFYKMSFISTTTHKVIEAKGTILEKEVDRYTVLKFNSNGKYDVFEVDKWYDKSSYTTSYSFKNDYPSITGMSGYFKQDRIDIDESSIVLKFTLDGVVFKQSAQEIKISNPLFK